MIVMKNKKPTKRGNESRRIREKGESTFESIDERDEDNFNKGIYKKKPISSEENNISSSVDIEKLKIKKKGKGKKKVKAKNKQQDEMDNALMQLEKNNKEKMLTGELADLMDEIEKENKDFKKNVFFSNFHELNNHLGIFDDTEDSKLPEGGFPGLKDETGSPFGLIDKYTEKAQDLRKSKKKK